MSPATGREILLWVEVHTGQRYMKWVGKCERCELNGQTVVLNEETQISPGDDLEIFTKNGSTILRYCLNEQSAEICVAASRKSQPRPVKPVAKAPPPPPAMPSREALAAKLAKEQLAGQPAAPPPPPPMPSREALVAKLGKKQPAGQPSAAPPAPPMPSREALAAKLRKKQPAGQPSAAPSPPPMPSRDVLAAQLAKKQPAAPPPPPAAQQLRAQQPPANTSAPDPGDFLQQLAMAVTQQKARLQQVSVTAASTPNPTATTNAAGAPSQQMLQNALASLRRVSPWAPEPTYAAEVTLSDNFVVATDTRQSDPFARKLSTSTSRSSFEPTVYLADLGIQRMSGMHHRDSQSMRPSFAPVPEYEEPEAFAREVTGSVSMSPMCSSGQVAAAGKRSNSENAVVENAAVQSVPANASTPVSTIQPAQASPSFQTDMKKSVMGRVHDAVVVMQPEAAASCAGAVARVAPAGSHVSVPEASQPQPLQEQSISFSPGNGAAFDFKPPGSAATPSASPLSAAPTPNHSITASQARSISFAPPGLTPEVTDKNMPGNFSNAGKELLTQGSLSVRLQNPSATPDVASRSVMAGSHRASYVASAGAAHSARAESAAQVSHMHQQSPAVLGSNAEVLRLQYILSRVQTVLPEGSADVFQDVEGFISQLMQRMVPFGSGFVAGANADVQLPEASVAASTLTVQQELKRGLGRGKDLMMVRRSAPQATTVSRLSAPVGSHSRSRSRGSWRVQGPDFAVPARDPEGLVGRRLWRHFNNTGWAPGTVAEYLAPTAAEEGAHVISFNADTALEFEEQMNIMQPTEQVSWQDPNQKVRCQPVDTNGMPAVSVSQPPASEITIGAMVDAATPSAMGPWNANMAPSTAGSLAPSFKMPLAEATNSSPLMPLAGSVWATPSAFTDAHTAKLGANSGNVGASIPLPSSHLTVDQPHASLPAGTAGAGSTPAMSPPVLTPIPSRSVAGTTPGAGAAATGGDVVPESWWQDIHSGNVTRCTDMLTNMLRSPAAAQLPENLRLPLESAIASARASPTFNFGMNPAHTSETMAGVSSAVHGGNATKKTTGVPFGGYPTEEQEQEPSPMEGVEVSGRLSDMDARASSGFDLSTEFLDKSWFDQQLDGTDGNFTQPLSPSIWTAATAPIAENTAGNTAVTNAAGGFEWLVPETETAPPLSSNGGAPASGRMSLPAVAGAASNHATGASSEKQGAVNASVSVGPAHQIRSTATGSSIPKRPGTSGSGSVGASGGVTTVDDSRVPTAATAVSVPIASPVDTHGAMHAPSDHVEESAAAQQIQQPEVAHIAGSSYGDRSVGPHCFASVDGPTLSQPEAAANSVHGRARASTATASSFQVRDQTQNIAENVNTDSRPASPLSALGIPPCSPSKQPTHSIGAPEPQQEHLESLLEQSISVGIAAGPSPMAHETTVHSVAAHSPHVAPSSAAPQNELHSVDTVDEPVACVGASDSAGSPPAAHVAAPASPTFLPSSRSPPTSPADAASEPQEATAATLNGGAGTPQWRESAKAGVPKSPLSSAGLISGALSPCGSLDAPAQAAGDNVQTPVAFSGAPVAFAAAAESIAGMSTLHVAAQFSRYMDATDNVQPTEQNVGMLSEPPLSAVSAAGSSHSPAARLSAGNPMMMPLAANDTPSPMVVAAPPSVSAPQGAQPLSNTAAFGSPTAVTGTVATSGATPAGLLQDLANAVAQGVPECTPEELALPAELFKRRVTPVVSAWRSTDHLPSPSPSPNKTGADPATSVLPHTTTPVAANMLSPQEQRQLHMSNVRVADMPPNTGLRGAATPNVSPMSAHPSAARRGVLPVNLTDVVTAIQHAGMYDEASPASAAGAARSPLAPRSAEAARASSSPGAAPPSLAPFVPDEATETVADAHEQQTAPVLFAEPSAEEDFQVVHETAAQEDAVAELTAEQIAAIRAAAKRPSMLLQAPTTELENSEAVTAAAAPALAVEEQGVGVPAAAEAPDEAPADTCPAEQENDDPPGEQDAPRRTRAAKLADISVTDAKEALAVAKAATEADGPARRTRRRVSIAPAPAPAVTAAPVAPSHGAATASNMSVGDARAALAAAKASSSQGGSVLRTRKRLSMSVSADVDSVREAQDARLAKQAEEDEQDEEHDEEDVAEMSPNENACDSNDAEKGGHQGQNTSAVPPDEEDAAPKRPMTRRRRASVAVHQGAAEIAPNEAGETLSEGPHTRTRRDESAAAETEAPQTKGMQPEQGEPTGHYTRTRARRGADPVQEPPVDTSVQPAQQHVSTGEPTASDTTKTRRGTAKRGRAALAAGTATAPDPAATDGNVSDSEGPVTRRQRAKTGAVPVESEDVTAASGDVWGSKKRRGRRGNKAEPADRQAESFSTGVVTDMSESMAGGENEGLASANCATSKMAGLGTTKEAEGIRTENFRPKLSAVPEDDQVAIKRGKPGRRKKPYQPIPEMLSTLVEQPVRRSRRTCSQTTS